MDHHGHHSPILVVDAGSSTIKAGYAGDDSPLSILPSTVPNNNKPAKSNNNKLEFSFEPEYDSVRSSQAIEKGHVKNWDELEALWKLMMNDMGLNSIDTTSVLITEPPKTTTEERTKWAQMLFETFRVPAIMIANSASLSLFASGRTTGLVLDCGAGLTSSVPVYEGLALTHAINIMEYAGNDVTLNVQQALSEVGIKTDFNLAKILKEKMSFVYSAPDLNITDQCKFSLPDGNEVTVDKNIFGKASEPLFSNESFDPPGLIHQLYDSIKLCDDSLVKDLSQNIIIAGGSTMMNGFGDRIQSELLGFAAREPPRYQRQLKIRVSPSSAYREAGYTTQRRIAAWIGGSIVASLDTFKQIKITRQEWEEDADASVRTKFV